MTDHKASTFLNLSHFRNASNPSRYKPVASTGNRGFTLVELLMVIMIIAGLAAIIIPSYNNYVSKASNSRASSEVRTISTEISGWALDHDNKNPIDLTVIGRDTMRDPWKNPYQYSPVPVLKEPLDVEFLNTDFDIYSKGPDGAGTPAGGDPGNKDDIVRANNGAFTGLREP